LTRDIILESSLNKDGFIPEPVLKRRKGLDLSFIINIYIIQVNKPDLNNDFYIFLFNLVLKSNKIAKLTFFILIPKNPVLKQLVYINILYKQKVNKVYLIDLRVLISKVLNKNDN
jgi:hypothetical protein